VIFRVTAEKLPVSDGLQGGYLPSGAPGPLLANALTYINNQVALLRAEVHQDGLDASTTIILSAKHGQSPIDSSLLRRVNDATIISGLNSAWTAAHSGAGPLAIFSTDDDGMLLWLSDRSPAALDFAKEYLLGHSAPANLITDPKGTDSATVAASELTAVYTGAAADQLVGAKPGDPHAPDLIGIAQHGVVYTGGVAKIAEHGGAAADDRDVALVVSGAGVSHNRVTSTAVQTTQIAPTILSLLGLDPHDLQAVQVDHTDALPVR